VPAAVPAAAEALVVTHWGEIMDGVPWAVALDKGYLKADGLNITGFVGSKGGGTTIRNIVASPLPYGEVAPSAAITAILAGVPIKIVNNGVQNVSDFVVAVKRDSGIDSLKDLVGKKWALTSPKSNTDILSQMMLDKVGIPIDKVQRPALGSTMAGIQALETNSVQAVFILEPVWSEYKGKLKELARPTGMLPPTLQTVGVASTAFIKAHPDKVRAIIEARRKGVEFTRKHPDEAAAILVKHYEGLDKKTALDVINELAKTDYWSEGAIDFKRLQDTVTGMKLVGVLKKDVDLKSMVDTSMLPQDAKKHD
jgi:NitT/TauT family transport system substrate-binding protein